MGSSKGNQRKYKDGDFWYKSDYLGYEAASEYLASWILGNSNCSDFVKYEVCKDSGGVLCRSLNFLREGESIVTLARFFQAEYGFDIQEILEDMPVSDQIQFVVECVSTTTGLTEFGSYLTDLLRLDSLILNEDRHLQNIALIFTGSKYRLAPIFDNGAGFLSDTRYSYPMEKSVWGTISSVTAKPFSPSFSEQLAACEQEYPGTLKFELPSEIPVSIKNKLLHYYNSQVVERLEDVYRHQVAIFPEFVKCQSTQSLCAFS